MTSSDLQRIIVDILKSTVPSVAGRVYDSPPPGAPLPFISIGPSFSFMDDADCSEGRVEVMQLDVWASALPNRAQAKNIADEIVTALHFNRVNEDETLRASPFRITQLRIMSDPNPDIIHGVVQFEVFLEHG